MSRISRLLLSKVAGFCSATTAACAAAKPVRLTKKACVALLGRCQSIKIMKQIHCQVLLSGLNQSRDVVDDVLLFLTDRQSGDLQYASKVFDSLLNPSLFAFNLMIRASSKIDNHKNALFLYNRMRETRVSPDNFTYPFVLKALGRLRKDCEGRKTHGLVVKDSFEFDPYVRNSLIDMYGEFGSIEAAGLLFDEMPQRDVITWNVLISAYVKCKKFAAAVSTFREMKDSGVEPDEATLVSCISACAAMGNMELGKKIHSSMEKELRFSVPLGNAIVDMYAKCGNLEAARLFFDIMPTRNVISWTSMVSGYANAGQLGEARKLFDESPTRDVILWTAMINGYVQYNRFDEALSMFREMQMKNIKPDKFTIVALLTLCASLGALEQGKWIHGYVEEKKMQIDNVVCTALIDMYSKCGFVNKSLEIFGSVEEKDRVTWTSIICGLALNGQARKALELFSEMVELGLEPDDITFIGVLSACNHGGFVGEGRKLFHEMKEKHRIEPKIEHLGCLVDLLGRAGHLKEAEELLESIQDKSGEDVLPLWGALLGACRIHGDLEGGKRVARRVVEMEAESPGLHTLAANVYAAAERWRDVGLVRKKMKNLGIKKKPGCSSIEVNGRIREFIVDDIGHQEYSEIRSILHDMSKIIEMEERREMGVGMRG
ncbi:Pentatricopeptide repeat-containing protein [Apostasia shenzhenica]|uniref:Pentatricopeptide repeat-containing protein n=1 Tax=Apostasia shenzhenica TaxID=1088818 RepID=A0A2I0A1Z4_9ASPA|nr:Pentatricopeptide repeat-containing protein [Apostasia shenzhenica]